MHIRVNRVKNNPRKILNIQSPKDVFFFFICRTSFYTMDSPRSTLEMPLTVNNNVTLTILLSILIAVARE